VLSGAHAASGRQVSTWAHAVIAGKSISLGGSLSTLMSLPMLVFLTTLTILESQPSFPIHQGFTHRTILHHRPLIKHAPWEPAVTLELSCVSPVKPDAPCNYLSLCCVLVVGGYSPHGSLTECGLLPSYVLLPSFVVSIALLELT
jgi:hypothetical protein